MPLPLALLAVVAALVTLAGGGLASAAPPPPPSRGEKVASPRPAAHDVHVAGRSASPWRPPVRGAHAASRARAAGDDRVARSSASPWHPPVRGGRAASRASGAHDVRVAGRSASPWRPPVPGHVARGFSYRASEPFAAGRHRGVDLAAAPGSTARAACTGRVVTARFAVVTLRCGPWRVTHLPLASVSVRAGALVMAGTPVGRVGTSAGHAGLHLGVRRAGAPFAYVDPLPFLRGSSPSPPPAAVPAPRRDVPRSGPRESPPRVGPRAAPAPRGAPAPAPLAAPAPLVAFPVPASPGVRVSMPEPTGGVAPWPAWAGLAVLLLGAVGGGVRIRVRRRRAALAAPVASVP